MAPTSLTANMSSAAVLKGMKLLELGRNASPWILALPKKAFPPPKKKPDPPSVHPRKLVEKLLALKLEENCAWESLTLKPVARAVTSLLAWLGMPSSEPIVLFSSGAALMALATEVAIVSAESAALNGTAKSEVAAIPPLLLNSKITVLGWKSSMSSDGSNGVPLASVMNVLKVIAKRSPSTMVLPALAHMFVPVVSVPRGMILV